MMDKLTVGQYLNSLKVKHRIKTDTELCHRLGIQKPVLSKVRSGATKLSAYLVLRLHECLGCEVAEIRQTIREEDFSLDMMRPEYELFSQPRRRSLDSEKVFMFIESFTQKQGVPVTVKDISARFSSSCKSSIYLCVSTLESEGKIRRLHGAKRNIVVVV